MSWPRPLSPDAPRVWTIPPGADFLCALAETLAEDVNLKSNPAALADALIYVPNRRSARGLALAFHRAGGGRTILPPEIRALGDLELDEAPSGAEEALTDLGPILPSAKRLGALAALVMQFYEMRGLTLPPMSSLAAARELGRLLDSAALAGGADWSKLPDLVSNADLAAHWVDSVEFLRIVTEFWPNWLKETGATEPFERRLIVAKAIANAVREAPPKGPFIIAGSTGATPATRTLMQAAQSLPQGLVILPGLDRNIDAAGWELIGTEPDHPQHSLSGTLKALKVAAKDVPIWPGTDFSDATKARNRLIYESLAPASQTADWLKRLEEVVQTDSVSEFAEKALSGLSVIEAADTAEEALLTALSLREALETDGQTAALITPDATLARQVSALLKRWGLTVSPSGGIPLGRTPQGALMQLTLRWAQDTGDPVALTALLKHDLVAVDKTAVNALEQNYLRGPRRWTTVADLVAKLPTFTETAARSRHTRLPDGAEAQARTLLTPLISFAEAAACFEDTEATLSGPEAVTTLSQLITELTGDAHDIWSGRAGEAAARCLENLAEVTDTLAGLTPPAFADILENLAANHMVQAPLVEHPRLSIWGPLEARLQQADRIILAGLNEGVWPDRPAADAFLPRRFREPLGLPAPEVRLGLAAHDFAQLAAAPDVLLLYSARRDDAPAIASRWLLRLKTLAEGALGTSAAEALSPPMHRDPRPWANALTADRQSTDSASARPTPNPPVTARPKKLSVTRINTLQRDPYAIYASDILKLTKLESLNAPLDMRPRGTAIHAALEAFETLPASEQTAAHLHKSFLKQLIAAGQPEHLAIAEHASLAHAASAYVEWWQDRQHGRVAHWEEEGGRIEMIIAGEPFALTGIADSIQKYADGSYAIIDFKTGAGKTRKEIEAGFEQQLPLLAAMARDGHMRAIPAAPIREFGYVSVRYNFEAPHLTRSPEDANALADTALGIVEKLITAYRTPEAIYLSAPRVQVQASYAGDFDLLARRAEWAGDTNND